MRNNINWNKLINILLVIATACVIGAVIGLAIILPNANLRAVELNPSTVGIDFKSGKLDRVLDSVGSGFNPAPASGDPNGEFDYEQDLNSDPALGYIRADQASHTFKQTITQDSYNMLYNHLPQTAFNPTNEKANKAENFYINFGAPYSADKPLTRIVSVDAKLYNGDFATGTPLYLNTIITDNNTQPDPNKYNQYWYQYFDLKGLRELNIPTSGNYDPETEQGAPLGYITNTEGKYEFTFHYAYTTTTGTVYTGNTFTFSFYVINQTYYYNNYPTMSSATEGQRDNANSLQYFYNFQYATYPAFTFDASRYNLSYTRTRDNTTETVTTSFALNPTNSNIGVLTVNSVINGQARQNTIEVARVTGTLTDTFPLTVEFSEFGVYDLTIRYVFLTDAGYTIVNSITPYAFDFFKTRPPEAPAGSSANYNPYEETGIGGHPGEYAQGKMKLHIFGIKAYYTRNGEKVELRNIAGVTQQVQGSPAYLQKATPATEYAKTTTFVSDFTSRLRDADFLLDEEGRLKKQNGFIQQILANANGANVNFPSVNLIPISFDYFGRLNYNGLTSGSYYNVYKDAAFTQKHSSNPTGYITKDSSLPGSGDPSDYNFYEAVIRYDYSGYNPIGGSPGSGYLAQVFAFEIDRSDPTVTLLKTEPETSGIAGASALHDKGFTNWDVHANWADAEETPVFKAPIWAELIRTTTTDGSFTNITPVVTPYTKQTKITAQAKYLLRVYYWINKTLYNEYSFTIDKVSISGNDIRPINVIYEPDNPSVVRNYTLASTDAVTFGSNNGNNRRLINQPFTLVYNPKASGAEIITTYRKIPFEQNTTPMVINPDKTLNHNGAPGTAVDSNNKLILTNYSINYAHIGQQQEYPLDLAKLANGEISAETTFMGDSSYIYLFTMTDAAGNSKTDFAIYDLTKPYVIIDKPINNPYNIVSDDSTIHWGSHKMVPVLSPNTTPSDPLFKIIDEYRLPSNQKLFHYENGTYYMGVPVTQAQFTYSDTVKATHTFTSSDITGGKTGQLLKWRDEGGDATVRFFSGEKIYEYYITDYSHVPSGTSISKNNVLANTIWMNLDNSVGLMYANYGTGNNEQGRVIKEKAASSANQLRFSWIQGSSDSEYEVKSVQYLYYDYTPSSYSLIDDTNTTRLENLTTLLGMDSIAQNPADKREPKPTYPYSVSPNGDYQTVHPSNLRVREKNAITGIEEEQSGRILSNILQPEIRDGVTVTKEGFYVVRREYVGNGELANGGIVKDPKIRYYYYWVTRYGIIDITPSVNDTDAGYIYEMGNGISFRFSNDSQDTAKYSAKDIQNYLTYVAAVNNNVVFDSNKLPVKLSLPKDKFNTMAALNTIRTNNPTGLGSIESAEFNTIRDKATQLNSSKFELRYLVEFKKGTTGNEQWIPVIDTINVTPAPGINTSTRINSNYVALSTQRIVNGTNNIGTYDFIHAGSYRVTLYDDTNASLIKIANDPSSDAPNATYNPTKDPWIKKLDFSFDISHESPRGQYYGAYKDGSPQMLDTKVSDYNRINLQYFTSTNNETLRFTFADNANEYKAKIDPTKTVVERRLTGSGSYTIIYPTAQNPYNLVNSTNVNNNIFSYTTHPVTGLNTYTLTVFNNKTSLLSGVSYQQGEYRITLKYAGNENDYNAPDPDNPSVTRNFSTRTFSVYIDTTQPENNLTRLRTADAATYGVMAYNGITNKDLYFYATTPDTNFVQTTEPNSPWELDSRDIFIRALSNPNNTATLPVGDQTLPLDFPTYYQTITPDNPNFNNGEYQPSSPRFSEANTPGSASYYHRFTYDSSRILNMGDMMAAAQSLLPMTGSGYYEVVERDEAGNYRVYAIQYNANAGINSGAEQVSNGIQFFFNQVGKTDTLFGSFGSNKSEESVVYPTVNGKVETHVSGLNLTFGGMDANDHPVPSKAVNPAGRNLTDYFMKCIITYGTTTKTIYNNPYANPNHVTWDNFINAINAELEFSKVLSKTGYTFTITFVNRFNANYVINYFVPGDRLEPIFTNVTSGFEFVVPAASDSTWIKELKVYRFNNGWQKISIDSNSKPITENLGGSSLAGPNAKYFFANGKYKFVLIDNFNRGEEELFEETGLYPPYYQDTNVDSYKAIRYGAGSTLIDGIMYTANAVVLDYSINFYDLKMEVYDNALLKFVEVEAGTYGISATPISAQRTSLSFVQSTFGERRQYRITLIIDDVVPALTIYNFIITKELTNIQFRNTSGGPIATSNDPANPSVHTESFHIVWDASKFNPRVDLTRTYLNKNTGKQETQTIANINNDYLVSEDGTYTAKITNSLGYTHSSRNVYFKLSEGEIVVFDVIAVDNGQNVRLNASPQTEIKTITVGGVQQQVVVYKYYALKSFNFDATANKHIEIHCDINKGITVEDNVAGLTNEGSRYYGFRIYGTSNYAYNRYIQIIFVNEIGSAANNIFGVQLNYPRYDENEIELSNPGVVSASEIKSIENMTDRWVDVVFNSFGSSPLPQDNGNIISAEYFFNGQFVKLIQGAAMQNLSSFRITAAGVHTITFKDLAGNIQHFTTNVSNENSNRLTINLVNNAIFTVNDFIPINNQIFNGNVIIQYKNRELYESTPTVFATRNGDDNDGQGYPLQQFGGFDRFRFSEQGYYEVFITVDVKRRDGEIIPITTKHSFTIIETNVALLCFNIPQNNSFIIDDLLRNNIPCLDELPNTNELWISPAELGNGRYTVFVLAYVDALGAYVRFDFEVWINDETPYILPSIDAGTSQVGGPLSFEYNPWLIFQQIGESYITTTGLGNINITDTSVNQRVTQVLPGPDVYGDFWIRLYTKDHKLVLSYKLSRTEPLSTISLIIIIISSVVVVGLTVTFIIIRNHKKFK